MRHRLLNLSLVVFSCASLVFAATTAWAAVVSFDSTSTMALTAGGGYTNTINLALSYDTGLGTAAGNNNSTMGGSYSLELLGSMDTSANTVNVTGARFVKQSGTGNITVANFTVVMDFWLENENVAFSGVAGDLDSQGSVLGVSSGSIPMAGSLFWLNGGVGNATGLTSYTENFSTDPINGAITGSGSVAASAPTVTGNLANFTATVIVPVSMNASASGLAATTSGSMRALGTFSSRVAATYTWTDSSNSWTNVGCWNYGNFAPASGDSILMTNGGTIDLGGATQTVVNVGAASSGIVGTLQNGNLAFTGDMYVNSGTINANLSNSGGAGRLWIGGNSARYRLPRRHQ